MCSDSLYYLLIFEGTYEVEANARRPKTACHFTMIQNWTPETLWPITKNSYISEPVARGVAPNGTLVWIRNPFLVAVSLPTVMGGG